MTESTVLTTMRLDKWLWAVRFFKTRPLASVAISGGRVHLNGQRCKPAKLIQIGSQLSISKGPYRWDIEVCAIPKQRQAARAAHQCYLEAEESHIRREALVAQIRAEREQMPRSRERPTKKGRRLIHAFKRGA